MEPIHLQILWIAVSIYIAAVIYRKGRVCSGVEYPILWACLPVGVLAGGTLGAAYLSPRSIILTQWVPFGATLVTAALVYRYIDRITWKDDGVREDALDEAPEAGLWEEEYLPRATLTVPGLVSNALGVRWWLVSLLMLALAFFGIVARGGGPVLLLGLAVPVAFLVARLITRSGAGQRLEKSFSEDRWMNRSEEFEADYDEQARDD